MFAKMIRSNIVKIILSNKIGIYEKGTIRPIIIKGESKYQIELLTANQAFHKNINFDELEKELLVLFNESFCQIEALTEMGTYYFKKTKKGNVLSNYKSNKSPIKKLYEPHNAKKEYLIKEGTIVPPLIDLGVITKDGMIVSSKYDKYKQINRFLEIMNSVISDEKELNIIDFGCGKSYLTFVLYYYLTYERKIKANIIGLDLKEDVINKCNEIKDKYHYENLHFEKGDISLFKPQDKVDMIITLHACDTATDYALYNAIMLNVKYIFSVPCCQHEINQRINKNKMELICKYGLLKERFSSILTDAIRANILEYFGYKVDVMEFIDMIHSPKNILIRGKKVNSLVDKEKIKKEIDQIIIDYGISQSLYNLVFKK